jgi:hypothetical protein
MVVVVASIVGGGEKFSYGMVRSRKPLPLVPRTIAATTLSSSYQGTCTIQHGCIVFDSIPRPLMESIDDLTSTNKQARTSERTSKYTAPPNPQGDRPRSMRSLAVLLLLLPGSLDYSLWFSLSPFNGVVTLRKGLAGA